jgi:uncharacterized protein (TIGR02594 family)
MLVTNKSEGKMKKVYDLARLEIGTYEWAEGSNPRIDAYFDDVGYPSMTDETAWCAAFTGAMLKRSGYPHTGKLTARSYLDWGKPVDLSKAQPGDVVVLWRGSPTGWQGHVGFFDRQDDGNVYLLGGNQRDQVNVSGYSVDRVLSVRRMERTKKAQSTTLQATAGAATATAGGIGAVIAKLDPIAQYILLGSAAVIFIFLAWIARERIKRWVDGDR